VTQQKQRIAINKAISTRICHWWAKFDLHYIASGWP